MRLSCSYLAAELDFPFSRCSRNVAIMSEHAREIVAALDLQPVRRSDYRTLITAAAREAVATEQGATITKAVIEALKHRKLLVPVPELLYSGDGGPGGGATTGISRIDPGPGATVHRSARSGFLRSGPVIGATSAGSQRPQRGKTEEPQGPDRPPRRSACGRHFRRAAENNLCQSLWHHRPGRPHSACTRDTTPDIRASLCHADRFRHRKASSDHRSCGRHVL